MTHGIGSWFKRYDRALSLSVLVLVVPLVLVEPAYAAHAPFWAVPAMFHFYRRSRRQVRILGVALWTSIPVLVLGGFRYAGSENAFVRAPFEWRPLLGEVVVVAAVFLVGGAVALLLGTRLGGGGAIENEVG